MAIHRSEVVLLMPVIELASGNLLEAPAEALVNSVNTVGVMGKGIALQFKRAYPDMFKAYAAACKAGELEVGAMHVYETGLIHPRFIINFPTKRHWRKPSRGEYIRSGLVALRREVEARSIRSIAIPPIGCGAGGLSWSVVRPMVEKTFADLVDVRVFLFAPGHTPDPGQAKKAPVLGAPLRF
jgi:O-acetyl-ADP-ribose deacetylase (regulator of RNase III)